MATAPASLQEETEQDKQLSDSGLKQKPTIIVPPLSKDLVYNPLLELTETDPDIIERELPDISKELKAVADEDHSSDAKPEPDLLHELDSAKFDHVSPEATLNGDINVEPSAPEVYAPEVNSTSVEITPTPAEDGDNRSFVAASNGYGYRYGWYAEEGLVCVDKDNADASTVFAQSLTGTGRRVEIAEVGGEVPRPSVVQGSVLERMLREYLDCEKKLDGVYADVERVRVDLHTRRDAVWVKKTGVVEQTQPTRNGSGVVKAQVSFPHAVFSIARAAQMQEVSKQLRGLQFADLPTARFNRNLAKFRVEQFVYSFFARASLFHKSSQVEAVERRKQGLELTGEADKLTARHYFAVLREVEREVFGDANIDGWARRAVENLRGWALHVGSALVGIGDHMFLLYHAVRHNGVGGREGRWMASLVQPSEAIAEYCSSLAFLLSPSEQWQSFGTVQLGRGVGATRYQSDGRTSLLLVEPDFIKLFRQFPHEVFRNAYCNNKNLAALQGLLETLGDGMCRFQCYPQFARLLSSCAGDLLEQLSGDEAVDSNRFDALMLRSVFFAMQTVDRVALDDLPLRLLSKEASWRVLLSLVLDLVTPEATPILSEDVEESVDVSDDGFLYERLKVNVLSGIKVGTSQAREVYARYRGVRSLDEWVRMVESDQFFNVRFADSLPAQHRLLAMVELGVAHGGALANAVLRQLFVAFLACQAMTVVALIAGVCKAHPQMYTLVVQLVRVNLGQVKTHAEALLRALDLSQWRPTMADIACLGEWLEGGEVPLALAVLEGMNFGYLRSGELVMGAAIHREIAATLAMNAGRLEHNGARSVLSKWVRSSSPGEDYRDRCWQVLLKLKLVHSVSHPFYVAPLRLDNPQGSVVCKRVAEAALRLSRQLDKEDERGKTQSEDSLALYVMVLVTDFIALKGCAIIRYIVYRDDLNALVHPGAPVTASLTTLRAGAAVITTLVSACGAKVQKEMLEDLTWLVPFMSSERAEPLSNFLRWSGLASEKPRQSRVLVLFGAIRQQTKEASRPGDCVSFWFNAASEYIATYGVGAGVCELVDLLLQHCFAVHRADPSQGVGFIGRESLGRARGISVDKHIDLLHKCPWLLFEVVLYRSAQQASEWVALGNDPLVEPKAVEPWAGVLCGEYLVTVDEECPLIVLFWQLLFSLLFTKFEGKFVGFAAMEAACPGLVDKLAVKSDKLKRYFVAENQKCFEGGDHTEQRMEMTSLYAEFFTAASLWLRDEKIVQHSVQVVDSLNLNLSPEYALGRLKSVVESSLIEDARLLLVTQQAPDRAAVHRTLWHDTVFLDEYIDEEAQTDRPTSAENGTTKVKSSSHWAIPVPVYVQKEPALRGGMDVTEDPSSLLYPLRVLGKFCCVWHLRGMTDVYEAMRHSEQVHRFTELDKRVSEIMPSLYRKEATVKKEERKNEKEREAYVFEFHFEASVLDMSRQEEVESLSRESERALQSLAEEERMASPEEQALCLAFETVMQGLERLVTKGNKRVGKNWLVALLDAENHHTRMFPPSKKLLWESIVRAGEAFVEGEEMGLLLDQMLADRGRVPLLSALFNPCVRMESIVELYASVWEALPKIQAEELLPVLEKFNFKQWLGTIPPYVQRKRLLMMVGGVLKNMGWEQHAEARKVLTFHVQVYMDVCGFRFDEHIGDAVFQLVGAPCSFESGSEYQACSIHVAAHPTIWRRMMEIPGEKWASCHLSDITAILRSLASHFRSLRSFGSGASVSPSKRTRAGGLVSQWEPLQLVDLALGLLDRLVQVCLLYVHRGQLPACDLWGGIVAVFEPWLSSSLYGSSTPDAPQRPNPPWRNTAKENAAGSRVAKALLRIVNRLPRECMEEVFKFVTSKVLPCAPGYVINAICIELVPMESAWQHWLVSVDSMQELGDMAGGGDLNARSVCLQLICAVNWEVSIEAVGNQCSDVVASKYLSLILKVVVNVVWSAGLPMQRHLCAFIKTRVSKLQWKVMLPEDYSRVVEHTKELLFGNKRAAGEGLPGDGWIKSEQERTVVLLNVVGNATCLEACPRGVIAEDVVLDSIEKECMFLGLLQHLLKQVAEQPRKEEAQVLRMSPASYVMVLYSALRRVKAVLVSETKISQRCRSYHDIARFHSEDPEVKPLVLLLSVSLEFLNLPGVAFKAPLPPREESDHTTVSYLLATVTYNSSQRFEQSLLLEKIDHAVQIVSSVVPVQRLIDAASGQGSSEERASFRESVHDQPSMNIGVWESWQEMLELLLPSMSAAANARQATAPTGRLQQLRKRALDSSTKSAPHLTVTGGGVGILLWKLLESIGNLSPMVIACISMKVKRVEICAALMEHCIDCWLLRSCEFAPLVSAMRGVVDTQDRSGTKDLSHSDRKTAVDGLVEECCKSSRWLTLYTLTLYMTLSGFKTKGDAFVMVSNALVSAEASASSRGSLYRIIPLICTWVDLVLSPLKGVATALKVQQLCEVREKVLEWAEAKEGYSIALSLSSVTSMLSNMGGSKVIPRDDFQLFALSLSAFLHLNCSRSQGRLRLKASDPLDSSRKTQVLVSSVADYAKGNECASAVKSFMNDMRHTLHDTHALIDLLCEQLYPALKWLPREVKEAEQYPPALDVSAMERVLL